MYDDKTKLLDIAGKTKITRKDKYKEIKEGIEQLDELDRKPIHMELKRDYEIPKTIDKLPTAMTLFVAVFSLLMSELVIVFGEGYIEPSNMIMILVAVCPAFIIIVFCVTSIWSYKRKMKAKIVIDVFEDSGI